MGELYKVLNPRLNAASTPYTFFFPDPELIKAVSAGRKLSCASTDAAILSE